MQLKLHINQGYRHINSNVTISIRACYIHIRYVSPFFFKFVIDL